MKRRKFIIGSLAVLTVPMLPNIQTKEVFVEDYVAWFKKEFGESPYYITPNDEYYVTNLINVRKGWSSPTPIYRRAFGDVIRKYTQEEWDIRQKEELEMLKVLTFEEYKRYIA